jgi:hypothetical protein
MRGLIVSLSCLVAMTASAAEDTLAVPSDPTAKYIVLERHRYPGAAMLLIRREGPSGTTYFQRYYRCQDRTVTFYGDGDSLQALRRSRYGASGVLVAEGTIGHDLLTAACGAQTSDEKQAAERTAMSNWRMHLYWRIREIRPARREGPLRSSNIDDREIGEIQAVTTDILPGAIVNIGGVVTGCPCEDGPSCSDQVWIVAYRPDKSMGLLLSNIDRRWQVGPVQEWWLDYENLLSRIRLLDSQAYAKAEQALNDRFPVCTAQVAAPGASP